MRIVIAATVALSVAAGSAQAKDMKACNADWSASKTAKTTSSQTHKQFMTTCLAAGASGVAAAPPTAPMSHPDLAAAPAASSQKVSGGASANATAKCKDGTFSMSAHHSGSCSHHGGVAQFLK